MLLSYTQICELIFKGVVKNADFECVNSASLDLRLGDMILEESTFGSQVIILRDKHHLPTFQKSLKETGFYDLYPGQFILAHSVEVFNLPNNISAEYKLKSSMARIGLEHLNAGWCDAGWNGSVLTLELKNMTQNHVIRLHAGDKIGQIVFFSHTKVPEEKSYSVRGRYNGDKSVSGVKK